MFQSQASTHLDVRRQHRENLARSRIQHCSSFNTFIWYLVCLPGKCCSCAHLSHRSDVFVLFQPEQLSRPHPHSRRNIWTPQENKRPSRNEAARARKEAKGPRPSLGDCLQTIQMFVSPRACRGSCGTEQSRNAWSSVQMAMLACRTS